MKKIYFIIFIVALVVSSAVILMDRTTRAHGDGLIPVNLSPTTTLTAETSNNTSAYSGFPSWSDGDHAATNVSKVNIHTLLYQGNATKVFTLVEPWFCVNSPGEVSQQPNCGGHNEVGYNEDSSAQVTAQVNDMMSRGIDGMTCDFYGVGYDAKTDAEQQACDLFGQLAKTKTGFNFMMMEDDGSWKWRCSGSKTLESCIQGYLEQDLGYFNKNYYTNPAYYRVSGRPVVIFFVDENNPMTPLGKSGWATLWGNVRTWAASNGNPLFAFESSVDSGSNFWSYTDGAYAWPQPAQAQNSEDWQTGGYLPWYYNTLAKDNLVVSQGTAYKGFNDSLASWGTGRIIDQQCGAVWSDTLNEPTLNANFGANKQLQGVLIATWNDYEEGSEIETGIDNCISITSALTGASLSWGVTGNTNTLDHYTVYISTDGKNLAVLADNISPSVTSLDLSQYAIPVGGYTLYVKAVGKPSIVNHMSNAVSYAIAAGGSCVQATFNGGAVSVASTTPGGSYSVTCDYGFVGPGIAPTVGSGNCTYSKFTGTAAVFNCIAGTATGTFTNSCMIGNWNTGNYCLVNNPIASLMVVASDTEGGGGGGGGCQENCGGGGGGGGGTGGSGGGSGSGGSGGGSGGGGGGGYSGSGGTGTGGNNNEGGSTTSTLQATIASLLAELQSLITELNHELVTSFTRNLTIGSQGQDVKNLQMFLNDNGYPIAQSGAGSPGNESTVFGPKTARALAQFQAANGLPASGFFGGLTQALLKTKW